MIRIHTEPKSEQLAQNVAVGSSGSSGSSGSGYVQQAAAAAGQLTLTPSEWRQDFKNVQQIFNFFGPRSSDTTLRGYLNYVLGLNYLWEVWNPLLSPPTTNTPKCTAISHYFSTVAVKNYFSLHFSAINHVCQRYHFLFCFEGRIFIIFQKTICLKVISLQFVAG